MPDMNEMVNTKRIIAVLDLINQGQRELTIQNYALYVIGDLKSATIDEVVDFTRVQFEVKLAKEELIEAISELMREQQLVLIGERYSLREAAQARRAALLAGSQEAELLLKENFYQNLRRLHEDDLSDEAVDLLFTAFIDYIHESFYYYGQSAVGLLAGGQELQSVTAQQLLRSHANRLPDWLQGIFLIYIDNLARLSTQAELVYFDSLADRAEQFFSLGLSIDMANELATLSPLNWTVLADTNFLYSLLHVHTHNENPAVEALMRLLQEHQERFKLKIKYLPETRKELNGLKKNLTDMVQRQILTPNQLRAALRSGSVDGYTRAYYENQLLHGANTQHPLTILDMAVTILKSKGIELYNSPMSEIDIYSKEFTDEISDFRRFINTNNEARQESGFEFKDKSVMQIDHDIYLREAVLLLRSKANTAHETHIQDVKYFGLTLDKVLIRFDQRRALRTIAREDFVPSFFTPSYLLKKLTQFLPVNTVTDYRRAFLSSIASPIFTNDAKSKLSQTALSFFHGCGINDEQFIIKNLANRLLIDEIKNNSKEPEKIIEFIESEASKQLRERAEKQQELNKKLEERQQELDNTASELQLTAEEKAAIADKKTLLEQEVTVLSKGIRDIKKEIKKDKASYHSVIDTLNKQSQIPLVFSNEQDQIELARLRTELEASRQRETEAKAAVEAEKEANRQREADANAAAEKVVSDKKLQDKKDYIRNKIRWWRRRQVIISILVATLTLAAFIYMVSKHGGTLEGLSSWVKIELGPLAGVATTILVPVVAMAGNYFVIQAAFNRFHNESNLKAFRENIEWDLPEHLR